MLRNKLKHGLVFALCLGMSTGVMSAVFAEEVPEQIVKETEVLATEIETEVVEEETAVEIGTNAEGVSIDSENFPDEIFRSYVKENFDSDSNDVLSADECASVEKINVDAKGIESLVGVECFKNLTTLYCNENALAVLDISNNPKLQELECSVNNLVSLDVSKNIELESLGCAKNSLVKLDVSANDKLRVLWCNSNSIDELKLGGQKSFILLNCSNNKLKTIDLSVYNIIEDFNCSNNLLTKLDASNVCVWLNCKNNQIEELLLTNEQFVNVYCENNCLSELNHNWLNEITSSPQNISVEATKENGQWVVDMNQCISKDNLNKVTVDVGVYDSTTGKWIIPNDQPEKVSYKFTIEFVMVWDPENPAGSSQLNTMSPMEVNVEVTYKEAPVAKFVTRLYKVCLDREPDENGKADWVNRLTSQEITGSEAAYGFIFSDEFKNKNLCNADYIEQLYKAFMGRSSDSVGKQYWMEKLDSGVTREEVFNGFALSVEFKNLCEQYGILLGTGIGIPEYGTVPKGTCNICGEEDGVTAFVKRLYNVCLDRKADETGLAYWAEQLWNHTNSGRGVAYGFVFSEEFTNRGLSNEDYVEYLYEAFMGRASDSDGKADWVNRLEMGWTREGVFDGFAGSVEFNSICMSYGILRD